MNLLIVMIGGALGSGLRYAMSITMMNFKVYNIHLAIMIINIIGSFLMGLVIFALAKYNITSSMYKMFLTTGFLGGFTTFSTFSMESMLFITNGEYIKFFLYVLSSVLLSLLAFYVGSILLKGV